LSFVDDDDDDDENDDENDDDDENDFDNNNDEDDLDDDDESSETQNNVVNELNENESENDESSFENENENDENDDDDVDDNRKEKTNVSRTLERFAVVLFIFELESSFDVRRNSRFALSRAFASISIKREKKRVMTNNDENELIATSFKRRHLSDA
jgi:hypothetical protein